MDWILHKSKRTVPHERVPCKVRASQLKGGYPADVTNIQKPSTWFYRHLLEAYNGDYGATAAGAAVVASVHGATDSTKPVKLSYSSVTKPGVPG